MPFKWKVPPAQCNIPSHHQIQRQPRKNLHRTNRKTLKTKELLAQIVIHQQEIRTQHNTIKIFVGSKRQKPRYPRNIMENQEIPTSLQKQLKTMYSMFRRENGHHHLPRTIETFERSEITSKCRHKKKSYHTITTLKIKKTFLPICYLI